ncbi:hypothetical protein QBC39DRAFT_391170 [Podospora conica]|nr:hypothetical protein QBC39DRAFT_391170 [Schizothecium conicum]
MPVILPHESDHRGRPRQPQKKVDDFWRKFTTKTPGKATALLPKTSHAETLAQRAPATTTPSAPALASYDEAAALCRAKVDQIIRECRRLNQKYRDPHFDLEFDLKTGRRDCLESLDNVACAAPPSDSDSDSGHSPRPPQPFPPSPSPGRRRHRHRQGDRGPPGARFEPKSVARVSQIFDTPQFFIDGPTANDVRQGRDGDCWLMAALCTMSDKPGLIERVCVARDEAVGVYGFVFHRDGGWFSEVIDDKLYLTKPDYDEKVLSDRRPNYERVLWDDGRERVDSDEVYRRAYQMNSGALYFAQCAEPGETWLPLLEKAYAKAHGDYATLEGGFTGEGVEDLSGGVTSEVFIGDILDTESFWREEMLQVNKEFLFGCSTGMWGRGYGERKGIVEQHAYSIMRAVEMDGERLLLLKNPWGKAEWKGAWSDGSKEWTPEWLQKLGHRFGDDGAFWISYKDLLRKYQNFDRTRLFDDSWKVTSLWTTLSVPWTIEYHDTKFVFELDKPGPVVIVLSQLDDRYFRGLEGQYTFSLAFRVHKAGQDDYLVRTQGSYRMKRSVNVELELEAGEYVVLVKIDADRFDELIPAEDMVRRNAKYRREKLLRIALAYDLAHSKAKIIETEEEKAAREAYEKRKKEKYRERMRKAIMKEKERIYYQKDKQISDMRRANLRRKEKIKERKERKENEAKRKEEEARRKWEADQGPTVEVKGKSRDDKPGEAKPEDGEVGKQEKGVEADVRSDAGAKSEVEPKKTDVENTMIPSQPRPPPFPGHGGGGGGGPFNPADDSDRDDLISLGTVSDVTDRELDYRVEDSLRHMRPQHHRGGGGGPPVVSNRHPSPAPYHDHRRRGGGEDRFERDPWNAVAVVGLRVYYKVAEGEGDKEVVRLRVVRPNFWEVEEEEKEEKGEEGKKEEEVLDLDDSAKDATVVG